MVLEEGAQASSLFFSGVEPSKTSQRTLAGSHYPTI